MLSVGAGFTIHSQFTGENTFSRDLSLRVDDENSEETVNFDNKTLGLTYENFKKAKYYYNFNGTREEERIQGLKHDGVIHTFRDIKSLGKDTYFLYLRYQDNASKFGDGWMELYRIEEQ